MSAGATTERVLGALRERLVGPGFQPGDRLDPTLLARHLAASATPVREALHVLTGEGLVEARSGGGFNLPFLDAAGLQHRYAWSNQLLALAVHSWPRRRRPATFPFDRHDKAPIAERIGNIFIAMGRQSTNSEHGRAIGRLTPRLHRIRLAEVEVLDGLDAELDDILITIESSDSAAILHNLAVYHRRRRKNAADILHAVYLPS